MANVMSIEKRNTILRHLVEGNSIRSTCRLMNTNIPSVLRQLEWAGEHCEALLNDRLQGLNCRHLECERKIENLEAAVNLHMAYYNFCWRPGTMRYTPAEAAGLTGYCWTFDELLA